MPPCANDQLRISALRYGAAGGAVSEIIAFTDISSEPCSLTGYPGVAALDRQGHQVEQARRQLNAMMGGQYEGTQPETVPLEPGGLATATVEGSDVADRARPTVPPRIPSFLVTAPDGTTSVTLDAGRDAGSRFCRTRIPRLHPLVVTPVVPGTTGSPPRPRHPVKAPHQGAVAALARCGLPSVLAAAACMSEPIAAPPPLRVKAPLRAPHVGLERHASLGYCLVALSFLNSTDGLWPVGSRTSGEPARPGQDERLRHFLVARRAGARADVGSRPNSPICSSPRTRSALPGAGAPGTDERRRGSSGPGSDCPGDFSAWSARVGPCGRRRRPAPPPPPEPSPKQCRLRRCPHHATAERRGHRSPHRERRSGRPSWPSPATTSTWPPGNRRVPTTTLHPACSSAPRAGPHGPRPRSPAPGGTSFPASSPRHRVHRPSGSCARDKPTLETCSIGRRTKGPVGPRRSPFPARTVKVSPSTPNSKRSDRSRPAGPTP